MILGLTHSMAIVPRKNSDCFVDCLSPPPAPQNFLHADIHVLTTCRIAFCRCIVYDTSRDAEFGCRSSQISLSRTDGRTCMYSSIPIEHCALKITVEDAEYVGIIVGVGGLASQAKIYYIFGLRSGQLCFPPSPSPSPTSVLYIHIYFPRTHIHATCLLQIWLQSNPHCPAQAQRPQYCHRVSLRGCSMGYHSVCGSNGRVILRDRMLSVTTSLVTWSGFIPGCLALGVFPCFD